MDVQSAACRSCESAEEPTCTCDMDMSDYVSMDDFEALRAEVRSLSGSIGSVEADNNDVMSAMEDMATCMSDIVDNFGGDGGDSTRDPKTTMTPETTMRRTT